MMHDQVSKTENCPESDCTTGKRNRFFRGKRMKTEEFTTEQRYLIGRRRLINRAMFNWGVGYGLKLAGANEAAEGQTAAKLTVGPGFALDRHGCEIVLMNATDVSPKNTFVYRAEGGGGQTAPLESIEPGRYLLAIHYAERHFGDSNLPGWCGTCRPEKNYLCETVVFSLTRVCDGKCPCEEKACQRKCACGGDSCCGAGRGPHACLCQWVTDTKVEGDTALCEWNDHALNPAAGVALACVVATKTDDKCAPGAFTVEDDCSPRRVLKNNELLYDLIRGCDLTRIAWISWGNWHRKEELIPASEFLAMLGDKAKEPDPVQTKLTVRFTGPVDAKTVTADCFAMKVIVPCSDTGWFETRIANMTSPALAEPTAGDPPGTTREATLCMNWYCHDECTSRSSVFRKEGAVVQIEVVGDLILDCHGQAVDANARGFALVDKGGDSPIEPSGNGTPGGTFVSAFRIDHLSVTPK